ncbi:hypothetical protein RA2_03874 [Roseovarius sp. A-2]|uniref:DUF3726 domain-containing protein n=1 Tax=Roseovarius sp. A-2 TaxID=1570360 RepID=UPI0009B5596C|nr:DUF3726 domain-containing protein [Roseovarius sp. A-2]GAW36799.1 hypothetical protein RA2_03874 [Roseovarius sp. A-2]
MMSFNDPAHSASSRDGHDAARVCLSLSEINALCVKAARGSGLSWGEAEEAGWAAVWLTRAGLAGPSIVLNWLRDCAMLARPLPATGHWKATSGPLCPLRAGLALTDHAGLPEGPGPDGLHIDTVAHPRLILPFVARAATRLDLPLRIGWAGAEITLRPAGTGGPLTLPPGQPDETPADLRIDTPDRRDTDAIPTVYSVPAQGIALTDWRALDALALRVTAPPSDASRARAGAAGDDND